MIPKETIDKIFESVKIEEVIEDFIRLQKKGVNYIGKCPFHNEKTPSFTVSPTKGIYKCFGCGKGGNAVKFIMELEQYNYPEALKYLAKKYQIEIIEKKLTAKQKKIQDKKEHLYAVSKFANKSFQDFLWNSKEGKTICLSYFEERGFSNEIIREFELGYNPKKDGVFTELALKNGFEINTLTEVGLSIKKNNSNKNFDRFKERSIFPIHNYSGRVVGFGGRAFNSKQKAKYLNSPESPIYYKSKLLYGIFQAKQHIAKENNCYIVEGYTDVISMHMKNVKNVVAASGTALGNYQLRLINRITENITLLFDGDSAGINATNKTIDLALNEGMNINIVQFPNNEDPDSLSKKLSKHDFQKFLSENSVNFVEYKITLANFQSLNDPKEIISKKRNIFKSISYIPDSLIRAEYCKKYFSQLGVSEEVMLQEVSNIKKATNSAKFQTEIEKENNIITQKDNKTNILYNLEKELIRLLLNYANNTFFINERKISVAEMIITDLDFDQIKFSFNIFNQIYNEVKASFLSSKYIDLKHFINHSDEDINKISIDLISEKHSISNNWKEKHKIFTLMESEKMKNTTEKAILSLKKCHVDIKIKELQKLITEGSSESSVLNQLSELTKVKTQISKSLGRNVG